MAGEKADRQGRPKRPGYFWQGLTGIGILLVGAGLVLLVRDQSEEAEAELIEIDELESSESGKIWVDLSGAVLRPGVYQLEAESRVNDVLVLAGGLDKKADGDWVSRSLNLARKLRDGEKIYVPFLGETGVGEEAVEAKININTAGQSRLEDLWGVGEATAKKIIEGRPYGAVEELLERKILKANVYEKIKDELSVY